MKLMQIMPVVMLVAKCLSFGTNRPTVSFGDLYKDLLPNIVTGKAYWYVGDTLRQTCVLQPKFMKQGYNASNIRFKKIYPFQAAGSNTHCIDPRHIDIYNQSTAQLVLPDVKELERVKYHCIIEPCETNTTPKTHLVGISVDIEIQYKPHNVTNFTCILYNWNEDMKCTWQHPVEYIKSFNDTNVTCSYKTYSSMNKAGPCPNLTFNECWWENINESMNHSIQINVTNSITGDVASTTFNVLPLNEVRPAAPKNIKVYALGEDDCFNITWQYHETQHFKKFNVSHQGIDNVDWKIIASGCQEMFWKICGLRPFTTHNFSVISLSKYPSDPSNFTYTTPHKVPLTGPEAINGSYTTKECNTKTHHRNVTLFWKDVKESDRNGIINRYIVYYKNLEQSVAKGNYQTTLTIPSTSHGETIKLFAENDAGLSVNPTILTIAPYHYKVPLEVKESFSIEITNNSLVRAVWQHNQNESVNFAVFWLSENSQAHILWKHVPKHQSYIDISITDPLNYDFGLVMSGDNFSWTSPIEWAKCFYEPTPISLPAPVEINVIPYEEYAVVTWENIKCSKVNRFKITSYSILYCPEDKCNSSADVQMVHVSARESIYKLSNLTAETSYNLTINIESFGVIQAWSKWKQFLTKSKSDETDMKWPIILIPTLIETSAMVVCVLLIACKRSRQRMKTFKDNAEDSIGTTEQNIPEVEVLGSDNGTNISTRPYISLNVPLISRPDGVEADYCDKSSLPYDSSSLLLNPSVTKSPSNGNTIISMKDFSPSHAVSGDYLAMTMIEEPTELNKEAIHDEALSVSKAGDTITYTQ